MTRKKLATALTEPGQLTGEGTAGAPSAEQSSTRTDNAGAPQLNPLSSKGRTTVFGTVYGGSNPSSGIYFPVRLTAGPCPLEAKIVVQIHDGEL